MPLFHDLASNGKRTTYQRVLQKRHTVNAHKGLSDIAFTSTDDSRLVQHASL
ncbi:hypothetical protein CK203_038964 [Vitis vinifera]|uniref:Uncharacterized protein n=1 Tax=Vitis vinifera TaxID=29760 RepID=A0A438HLU6_VITVI|nr:hypothetical protein CK203_038964 [Vitis vinifera]